MIYIGGKTYLSKHILPIMLQNRKEGQYYIEPFCGGCNCIDKVDGNRIANDINEYLIEMWKALINGWWPEKILTKEQYCDIRKNKQNYLKHEVGFAGFIYSYCGKWFGSYIGNKIRPTNGVGYLDQAMNNIKRQIPRMLNCEFYNKTYNELIIPKNSILYCDPPYKDRVKYGNILFDYDAFYNWCIIKAKDNDVFVTEYNIQNKYFKTVYEYKTNVRLGNNIINKPEHLSEKLYKVEVK
jgi:DNA adenine methylase